MTKIQKFIRVITVAPFMALFMLSMFLWQKPEILGDVYFYVVSVIFLVIFPLLAYPLQPITPIIRHQGRTGQRNMAIVMSVLGYIGGIIVAAVKHAPQGVWIIFLSYLFCGLSIQFFTVALKLKASGHACGVAGPMFLMTYELGFQWLALLPLLLLVCYVSYKSGRHTKLEIALGVIIPAVFLVGILIFV